MNKFGRALPTRQKGIRKAPNQIPVNKDGDYNIRDHKLVNVKLPTDGSDAANKKFIDDSISSLSASLNHLVAVRMQDAYNSIDRVKNELTNSSKANTELISAQMRDHMTILNKEMSDYKNSLKLADDKLKSEILKLNMQLATQLHEIRTTHQASIVQVSKQFDNLENILKGYITTTVKQSIKPITDDVKKINTNVNKLKQRVDRSKI